MSPRGSPRGSISIYSLKVIEEATGETVTLDANSTALTIDKGVRLNAKANATLTGNSTGVIAAGALFASAKTTAGKITANNTGVVLPNVYVGAYTTAYIKANSTGIMIGTKYISCNSTGNANT